MKFLDIRSYQALDSRGAPTFAVAAQLSDGSWHSVRVPSGASKGIYEMPESRDSGTRFEEQFYRGKSVFQGIDTFNRIIRPQLIGAEPNLAHVDDLLASLESHAKGVVLGANVSLAVSLVALTAEAHALNVSLARYFQPTGPLPIPMPMVNILSGGAHANRGMDIQDILVVPTSATSFAEAMSWIVAIREHAAERGRLLGYTTHLVADEGGLGIPFQRAEEALDFLMEVIKEVGLEPAEQINFAIDFAASQYFSDNRYKMVVSNLEMDSSEYSQYVAGLLAESPISSIVDPFAEDDWPSWSEFARSAAPKIQVIGDDLFVTSKDRLQRGIDDGCANAILIKVNQNGLVSRTFEVSQHAKKNNFATIVSARSGETEDKWLADLAVGWGANQIKVGSTHGSDRSSKWNRLLELEAIEETIFNPMR
jgi:enolase